MPKVLVVDDEPDTVNMIKSILEMYGLDVDTAHNGKECVKKVEKNNTDLVLLDIMMPDMSGWEIFKKIKKSQIGKRKMKVIFVSVVEITPERKISLIKEGLFDYINKPFTKDDLMERIGKAVKIEE